MDGCKEDVMTGQCRDKGVIKRWSGNRKWFFIYISKTLLAVTYQQSLIVQ